MILSFTIPGKVQAKQSARFRQINTKSGKSFIQSYQSAKVIHYAEFVKICFMNAYPDFDYTVFNDKMLAIKVIAYFEIPKSKSKKFKESALKGEVNPITKPDTDNISKNIKDALNKIAYPDDCQIVTEIIQKRYSETPRAEITISEIEERKIESERNNNAR